MFRHVLQHRADYCVPACVTMIELWRGEQFADLTRHQEELYERMHVSRRGCPLNAAAAFLGVRPGPMRDFDDDENLQMFSHRLDDNTCAVVTCFGDLWMNMLSQRGLSSPHGTLDRFPAHAVCVTRYENHTFEIFDPWSTREGQPLWLNQDEFVGLWTWEHFFVSRD